MSATQVTVQCPICSADIVTTLMISVDGLPTNIAPREEWHGGLNLDSTPIETHLMTHS